MKPHLVVIAGPNGSGKTTFTLEYLKFYSYPYVSADDIAESMDPASIEDIWIQAGRNFLKQISKYIDERKSFIVESTLSGRTFINVMKRAHQQGFRITIVFIFLDSEKVCIARIRERIRKGGHAVSEEDIQRRFFRSITNFWKEYRLLADQWYIFYNGGEQFHEVALGEKAKVKGLDEILYDLFLRLTEEKI